MKKQFFALMFLVYLLAVAVITIVPTRISRLGNSYVDHINLTPLKYSYRCIMLAHRRHPDLMGTCLRNTLGNIALFLPLGFLLPLVFPSLRSWRRVLVIAFCFSLSIETIQFLARFIGSGRSVDIDDVLLNTLGACIGYAIYRLGATIRRAKGEREK